MSKRWNVSQWMGGLGMALAFVSPMAVAQDEPAIVEVDFACEDPSVDMPTVYLDLINKDPSLGLALDTIFRTTPDYDLKIEEEVRTRFVRGERERLQKIAQQSYGDNDLNDPKIQVAISNRVNDGLARNLLTAAAKAEIDAITTAIPYQSKQPPEVAEVVEKAVAKIKALRVAQQLTLPLATGVYLEDFSNPVHEEARPKAAKGRWTEWQEKWVNCKLIVPTFKDEPVTGARTLVTNTQYYKIKYSNGKVARTYRQKAMTEDEWTAEKTKREADEVSREFIHMGLRLKYSSIGADYGTPIRRIIFFDVCRDDRSCKEKDIPGVSPEEPATPVKKRFPFPPG